MASPEVPNHAVFTRRTRTLGIVSAWTGFALFQVYSILSGIAYASHGAPADGGPLLSGMALMIVAGGPFLVLSMVAVHAYAPRAYAPFSLGALIFMSLCVAMTSCINFSLWLTTSQPALFAETWRALFLPFRWPVPAFILDTFVWDWFFGISMLLAAPIFSGDALRNGLRVVMFLSGGLCLLGLAWLAVSPPQGVIIGILGWGAAGPIALLLLAKVFGRTKAESGEWRAAERRREPMGPE